MPVRRLLLSFTIAACLAVFALPAAAAQPAGPAATIQSLIDAAAPGATVNVPAGTFVESLTINKNLTLSGKARDVSILKATAGNRVITITPKHTVTLLHLTITGGEPPQAVGGGILSDDSSLVVTDCVISGNSADYGGGIFQSSSDEAKTLAVTNSIIEDNVAWLTAVACTRVAARTQVATCA